MHVLGLIAVGFMLGVIVTALYGKRIASAACADTALLINGVENRIHVRLDRFKTAAAQAAVRDIGKI